MTSWRFWLAVVVVSACRPALAEGGKTVVGRCLAVVHGRTEGTTVCSIDLAAGGAFSFAAWFQGSAMPFGRRIVHLVPVKATHLGTASMADPDGAGGKDATTAHGTMTQQGPCWVGERATLCAWDGQAEMRRNRTAPYTASHTLLGRSVRARCQMGDTASG